MMHHEVRDTSKPPRPTCARVLCVAVGFNYPHPIPSLPPLPYRSFSSIPFFLSPFPSPPCSFPPGNCNLFHWQWMGWEGDAWRGGAGWDWMETPW